MWKIDFQKNNEKSKGDSIMTKKIYTRKLAVYLREKGFKILSTEVNYKYPQYDVYVFEDTPELTQAILDYNK